jgi:magnesium chelatase subunit I
VNAHNPRALHDMLSRLLEAMQRGLWQSPGDYQTQLENLLLDHEQQMEGTPPMTTAAPMPVPFPFAAIAGQPQLRQALLLAAVDPGLGGVLIEGPRGTAKTTAARALAELLPGAPFVTLPLGASLESLVGTLDLGQALAGHELKFAPGLLARAHGGVLYVDEINLLPDALIDSLLDAAASGVNVVERDGISHRHAARFVLVGTMNPEEGTLRPQLLDRFGLCVQLRNIEDAAERQAIVRARLAFDADPQGFRAKHAQAEAALAAALVKARAIVADARACPMAMRCTKPSARCASRRRSTGCAPTW